MLITPPRSSALPPSAFIGIEQRQQQKPAAQWRDSEAWIKHQFAPNAGLCLVARVATAAFYDCG